MPRSAHTSAMVSLSRSRAPRFRSVSSMAAPFRRGGVPAARRKAPDRPAVHTGLLPVIMDSAARDNPPEFMRCPRGLAGAATLMAADGGRETGRQALLEGGRPNSAGPPAEKMIYGPVGALGFNPAPSTCPLRLPTTVQQVPDPCNCRPLALQRPHMTVGVRRRPLVSALWEGHQ